MLEDHFTTIREATIKPLCLLPEPKWGFLKTEQMARKLVMFSFGYAMAIYYMNLIHYT